MDPSCLVSTAQASGGGVPLSNLQQLHDAIVSARTNIPVERFRLVESMPRRIPADLAATGVQPSTRWVYLINWQLLGVAFLGIGLWAWSEKGVLSNISSITDLGGFDPVWLFLVVGGVMFILGFAGCIGALRENSFLLKFFSVFLGIIFFLELTAGVLAFVFKDWIKDQLNFFINNNIRAYRDDIDLQNLIDFTQEYWECCGAFGADDWNLNIYFNCTDSNPSREKCGVPFSCCTKDPAEDVINTQCGYDIRAKAVSEQRTFIYIKGCVPQFEKWLQDNLTVVAGIFIGIALLQIFGICLAQNLVSDIEVVRESCLFT
ncbi:tetraspanin-5 isoform X1 [Salvelinus sp. IW2-2015]|uniref:tetraspanin-5 isoform X1 n=1 Tax=Salvelinus sp. IW2-2015 TaxID=2691554 RepID=UPI000CEAAE53|nr:tetraspanin-5-like isoform X1 [Salvelinus alpinus]